MTGVQVKQLEVGRAFAQQDAYYDNYDDYDYSKANN